MAHLSHGAQEEIQPEKIIPSLPWDPNHKMRDKIKDKAQTVHQRMNHLIHTKIPLKVGLDEVCSARDSNIPALSRGANTGVRSGASSEKELDLEETQRRSKIWGKLNVQGHFRVEPLHFCEMTLCNKGMKPNTKSFQGTRNAICVPNTSGICEKQNYAPRVASVFLLLISPSKTVG